MLLRSSRSWTLEVDGALTLLKILDCIGGWCSYAPQELVSVEVDGALKLLKILECRVGWCSYAPQDLGV